MKLKLDRKFWIKVGCILLLFLIAPFAFEVLLLADVVGAEFAILFAIYYLKSSYYVAMERWQSMRRGLLEFFEALSLLYVFQPRIIISHSLASAVLLLFTCSALLTCLLWILPIYLSASPVA